MMYVNIHSQEVELNPPPPPLEGMWTSLSDIFLNNVKEGDCPQRTSAALQPET